MLLIFCVCSKCVKSLIDRRSISGQTHASVFFTCLNEKFTFKEEEKEEKVKAAADNKEDDNKEVSNRTLLLLD